MPLGPHMNCQNFTRISSTKKWMTAWLQIRGTESQPARAQWFSRSHALLYTRHCTMHWALPTRLNYNYHSLMSFLYYSSVIGRMACTHFGRISLFSSSMQRTILLVHRTRCTFITRYNTHSSSAHRCIPFHFFSLSRSILLCSLFFVYLHL